jgi:hypothetical protein
VSNAKLKFVKPRKGDRKVYLGGEEVVRWAYYREWTFDVRWAYAITRGCKAYRTDGRSFENVPFAEYHAPSRPGDATARRASWSTHPGLQRSYTKLAALCRKDFEEIHAEKREAVQ